MVDALGRSGGAGRRLATETKQAVKATEFWAYVAVLVALLIAGAVTTGDSANDEADVFRADDVWLYVTLLTIGYMLSRGLAKSGSRDSSGDDASSGAGGPGLGDRVRAAASAYRDEGDTRQSSSGSGYEDTGETRQIPR